MPAESRRRTLRWYGTWERAFCGELPDKFAHVLLAWLSHQRWYLGKSGRQPKLTLAQAWPVEVENQSVWWLILTAESPGETTRLYQIPLVLLQECPPTANLIAQIMGQKSGVLVDAWTWQPFAHAILAHLSPKSRTQFWQAGLETWGALPAAPTASASLVDTDQSNTILRVGDQYFFKVFRALTPGVQPDEEVGRFLGQQGFSHIAQPRAAVHWEHGERTTLALCSDYIPNHGSAWSWLVHRLHEASDGVPAEVSGAMELLGQRTAGLHIALASPTTDPAFAPESLTTNWVTYLQNRATEKATATLRLLKHSWRKLGDARELAQGLVARERELFDRINSWKVDTLDGLRTRIHGDFHLGQVLRTLTGDWLIVDFEGEPLRPLAQRRMKDSPLRDLAGMLRSFAYARAVAHPRPLKRWLQADQEDAFGDAWRGSISQFLQRYFAAVQGQKIIPSDVQSVQRLLELYELEKVLYEVDYELQSRPDWIWIPLKGWRDILG